MLSATGVLLVSACGFGSVPVDPHAVQPGTEQVCAQLSAALPEVVENAVRREVRPESDTVAAWGHPPIILRCGVEPPVRDPAVALLVVDDVDWYPQQGEGGTFFSTLGRVATVSVGVPDDYQPPGDVLLDLAPAIDEVVPRGE